MKALFPKEEGSGGSTLEGTFSALSRPVFEQIETWAVKTPNQLALKSKNVQLDFAELNRRADALACRLQKLGVGLETPVAVCVESSPEMVVCLLAVWKAGGCYAPIDPAYPDDRIAYILQDLNAPVLLSPHGARFASLKTPVLFTDESDPQIATPCAARGVDNCHLAYIIYTSGSTGKPKGVEVTHGSLFNLVNWHCRAWDVAEAARATQIAGPAFDACVWEIWPYLAVGTSVHFPDEEIRLFPHKLMDWMKAQRISHSFCPTPLAEAILSNADLMGASLKVLLTGGDRLQKRPEAHFPARFINAYGPTENTVVSTCCEVSSEPMDRLPSIGAPISGTEGYIVNSILEKVPWGDEGELLVGGQSLARGYFRRPSLTAEKFIPNPFGPAGSRLYRTGDLTRGNEDASIQFVGRIDFQVKIRGFRIELGEIETVLAQHVGVQSCLILAREDLEAYGIVGKALIAYVARGKAKANEAELKDFLGQRLPEYMVPTGFVFLEFFPTTPNGKVDREALAAMDLSHLVVDRRDQYVAPVNPVEERLAKLWESVLGVEKVGVEDHFFSLGGHSLLLARLGRAIETSLSISPPMTVLFQCLTVRKQAQWLIGELLQTKLGEAKPQSRKGLKVLSRENRSHFSLSSAQRRLWFIDRYEPGSSVYNLPLVFRLEGNLDPTALRKSLDYLIERHEVLRTTFAEVDGEPVQIVGSPTPAVIFEHNLEGQSEQDALDLVREEAEFAFDLEKGPLVRFNLIRLSRTLFLFQANMHHIISDARSFQVFMEELGLCHHAFKCGEKPQLPPLPVQFVDYAAWEQEFLNSPDMEEQLNWWVNHLADPPVLELPADRPRPKRQTFRGRELRFDIPSALSRKLVVLANRQDVTPFMVMLAGYLLLLRRFSNRDDLVVGFPNSSRDNAELQGVLGFFINTLAPRFQISDHETPGELINTVRNTILEARSRGDLPLDTLVESLQPERDMSRSVLFQAVFSYFSKSAVEPEFKGVKLERWFFDRGLAHFDQLLVIEELEDGFSGSFEYNADLFNPSTTKRMADHYVLVLQEMTASVDMPLHKLAPLTEEESQKLLADWNQTEALTEKLIAPELFLKASREFADRPAMISYHSPKAQSITYGVLAHRVNHLAAWLWENGVRQETVIGICMKRSPEAIMAMLAIHALGGAYVPIDPIYPADRVAFMIEDAGIGYFFTCEDDCPQDLVSHAAGVRILYMKWDCIYDADMSLNWSMLDNQEPESFPRLAGEENTAYFIFTSGSTGRPKGVPIRHKALRNFINWFCKAYEVTPEVQGSLVAGPAFDGTIMEIWPYISMGCTIHIPPEDARLDSNLLHRFFTENGVTHTFCPTPIAEALMDAWNPAESKLLYLVTGGDRLRKRPQASFRGKLINVYGPSEASCIASFCQVSPEGDQLPDIGTVVQGARFYIVDAHMHLTPLGVPGELLIGGVCLSPGYLGRPSLAAAQFVPDPFGPCSGVGQPGERLYKTGDRVRYQPHGGGVLEFIDRIDTQVKIRGVRIELGEIEACLYGCPQVETALVMVRDDAGGDKRLVAYVQPVDLDLDRDVLAEDLRNNLLDRLPEYMIPDPFVFIDVFPLTPNGKINRKALPAPDLSRGRLGMDLVAPRNAVEAGLAKIWKRILNLEEVGVFDNFFHLGGHSLLATRVLSAIRDEMDCELPVQTIFLSPTIAEMARCMPESSGHASGIPVEVTGDARMEKQWPLSFAQQRLWFIQQMTPDLIAYNTPFAWRLRGAPDFEAFQTALNSMVERHESLRTVFRMAGDEAVQVVLPAFEPDLERIDLTDHAHGEEEAVGVARQIAVHLFDLEKGPLFRICLVSLTEDDHVFILNLHHIVTDGWSTSVFLKEFAALYGALRSGASQVLDPLPVQYPDYAIWQRSYLTGEVLEGELAFWRETLARPPVLEFPNDKPRPSVKTWCGSVVRGYLSADLVSRVKALGLRKEASLFHTFLAAFKTLLIRYTGQDDLIVGCPVAGRNMKALEDQIGFFVNTLAIRTRLDQGGVDEQGFSSLLALVRKAALESFSHQDIPFDKLVAELNPERDQSRSVYFDVMFSFQNVLSSQVTIPGFEVSAFPFETEVSHVDFTFVIEEMGEACDMVVFFNTDLFEDKTMERLLDHYRQVFEAVVESPDIPLFDIPILTEEERTLLLCDWDGPVLDCQTENLTFNLVAKTAGETPDRPALVSYDDGERVITYEMLIRRACGLSALLKSFGVGLEDRVGICVSRSPEALVVMLAIHAVGGVYVPIDPLYPEDRIAFMMEDASVQFLFTSRQDCPFKNEGDHDRFHLFFMDGDGFEDRDQRVLWSQYDRAPAVFPPQHAHPENAAYMIYTSGSTGRPKGVVISHRALLNLITWVLNRWHDGQPVRCALIAGPAFDATILEIWPYLTVGGTFHIPKDDVRLDPVLLSRFLQEHQITHAFCPTPLIESMIGEGVLPEMVCLVTGGDRLRKRPPLNYMGNLFNVYGPTEATVMVTSSKVASEGPGLPDIGAAVPNSRIYVVDCYLNPMPLGSPGELVIGGVCLSQGYYKRPALTAAQFVPDPFGSHPGARLYKTGDRVRYQRSGNGTIDFIDRLDTQVQIRGFRVELGEIEAVMDRFPGVAMSQALILDALGDQKLVGYVKTTPGIDIVDAKLRQFLNEALPDYMVPAAFVFLDAFPLTPNGKIDRRALPAPDWSEIEGEEFLEPRTEMEAKLAEIWAKVLGMERVGVTQSFFELGGHSLLATQIVSQVRRHFEVELSLLLFFKNPTIEHQALEIEAKLGQGVYVSRIKPVPRNDGEYLPVSFSQNRLYFGFRMAPESPAYNMPLGFHIQGRLHIPALSRALAAIVERHEALRVVFLEERGVPVQVVKPIDHVKPLTVIDLRMLADPGAVAKKLVVLEREKPFDLHRDPLVRWRLLQLEDDGYIALFTFHHVVGDGWSFGVFNRELSKLYTAFCEGEPADLPELPIQYGDFAHWQNQWIRGPEAHEQEIWWLDKLKGNLPISKTQKPRPEMPDYLCDIVRFDISDQLYEKLSVFCALEEKSLFMVLLGVFKAARYLEFGESSIVTGTIVANRNREEVEDLIGIFINTIALRVDVEDEQHFSAYSMLDRVEAVALEAFSRQEYPFDKLVDLLKPPRLPGVNPIFQALFIYNKGSGSLDLNGLSTELLESDLSLSAFDLNLTFNEEVEKGTTRLRGHLVYQKQLFERNVVQHIVDTVIQILEELTSGVSWSEDFDGGGIQGQHLKITPLGCANSSSRVYVLDPYMNPTPIGFEGDLYIESTHLARGYSGQPAFTAQAFIPNPFSSESGARLFATGERGCFDDEGRIIRNRTIGIVKPS